MAGKRNITITRGETFPGRFTWRTGRAQTPVNLTGCAGAFVVRADGINAGATLLDLNTGNGGMTLGGAEGTIAAPLSMAAVNALPWTRGFYTLVITMADGSTRRLVQGTVTVEA